MKIKEVLDVLNERFPLSDAEDWDNVGLLAGDQNREVSIVAFALDQSEHCISEAANRGAQLLITHHPFCMRPQNRFTDTGTESRYATRALSSALKHDVALAAYHTNLDRSAHAKHFMSAGFIGLPRTAGSLAEGYGMLFQTDPMNLKDVAAHFSRAFQSLGERTHIYGNEEREVKTIGFLSGSANDLVQEIPDGLGLECLVTGELSYHNVQEAHARGIDVITLGHDVSEQPYATYLYNTVKETFPSLLCLLYIEKQGSFCSNE